MPESCKQNQPTLTSIEHGQHAKRRSLLAGLLPSRDREVSRGDCKPTEIPSRACCRWLKLVGVTWATNSTLFQLRFKRRRNIPDGTSWVLLRLSRLLAASALTNTKNDTNERSHKCVQIGLIAEDVTGRDADDVLTLDFVVFEPTLFGSVSESDNQRKSLVKKKSCSRRL